MQGHSERDEEKRMQTNAELIKMVVVDGARKPCCPH